jgi:sugar/nucleoside kinase (ribokinase family)
VELHTGGCALSTASALVKLGVPTALCGCVGEDLFGGVLAREAAARGLDTGGLRTTKERTSASVVLDASDGERTFLHNPGAGAALTAADVEAALERSGARWLHIGGALVLPALDGKPLARLLERARHRGLRTSLDPVHDATGGWDRLHASLPHLDVICPNLTEARAISGESEPAACTRWLRDRVVRQVALKLGRAGAFALDGDTAEHVPSFEVEARDETGAGDAFAGGLVCGLLAGRPLAGAVRLANAVGALSTTRIGATSALPDLEEALALLSLAR